MYVRKAMNINSNERSTIDSLFRFVWAGSALHGPVGARHRGAVGEIGKQTALYAFGSLSGCISVLSADRLIGLRGADAPRTSLLCRTSEPKHEIYCDVRPALYWLSGLWKSNRFLKGSPVEPTKNWQEH